MGKTLYEVITTTSVGVWKILGENGIHAGNVIRYITIYQEVNKEIEGGIGKMQAYENVGERLGMSAEGVRRVCQIMGKEVGEKSNTQE